MRTFVQALRASNRRRVGLHEMVGGLGGRIPLSRWVQGERSLFARDETPIRFHMAWSRPRTPARINAGYFGVRDQGHRPWGMQRGRAAGPLCQDRAVLPHTSCGTL